MQQAIDRGRQKTPLKPVTIRMPSEDIANARNLAATSYQTYIKLLLRDALQREARKVARTTR